MVSDTVASISEPTTPPGDSFRLSNPTEDGDTSLLGTTKRRNIWMNPSMAPKPFGTVMNQSIMPNPNAVQKQAFAVLKGMGLLVSSSSKCTKCNYCSKISLHQHSPPVNRARVFRLQNLMDRWQRSSIEETEIDIYNHANCKFPLLSVWS